jgi:hypothetical protein
VDRTGVDVISVLIVALRDYGLDSLPVRLDPKRREVIETLQSYWPDMYFSFKQRLVRRALLLLAPLFISDSP